LKHNLIAALVAKIPPQYAQRLMASLATRFSAPVRHSEPSIILSADDDAGPSEWLLRTVVEAITHAMDNDLAALARDHAGKPGAEFYDIFPGEHYRLLASLAATLCPKTIVEIGTYTGLSAACLLQAMSEGSTLVSFDITPWHAFDSHLTSEPFAEGRIVQHLADLSDPVVFDDHLPLLNQAGMIFCDAPKDGHFEIALLRNLAKLSPSASRLFIFDDTRQLNMIDVWRRVGSPKMDATSFGHWTGTGLIDARDPMRLK